MPQQTCASHIPDVIHEFQEPQNKEMAKIVEEARAMQAAKVSFELHPEGDRGDTRAVFNLPKTVSLNSLTETFTVCARGGQFEMTVFHVCIHPVCFLRLCFCGQADKANATVSTTFYSPKPDTTAQAIADRIQQRLLDPNPPGAEACCIS